MFKDYESLLDRESLKKEPKELYEICEVIFSGSKNLRSRLISIISSSLQLKDEDAKTLCRAIEYIHNSSLLHDDFIDGSSFRRNQKTAWLQFSPEQAVLAGDYLLAQMTMYLIRVGNLPLLELTSKAIKSLARGEFLQRGLYSFREKNLEKINQVSKYKTGSLFQWCLKAPFIFLKTDNPSLFKLLDSIGYRFGLIYQRADDLLDFDIECKSNKPVLLDLKQSYYNSFSCYLMNEADSFLEKQYQECKSLPEIINLLPNFKEKLNYFHKDNQQLIQDTHKEIDQLKDFLDKKNHKLTTDLKTIATSLYLRQV